MEINAWEMTAVGEPLQRATRKPDLASGHVLVRVAGCGVCHTDLGFLYDGVKTRHALPLVLGHEISGTVEDAAGDSRALVGKTVIVPAVMPCGGCALCRRGRGSICPHQVFPGNDVDGGFASHVVVPALGLCAVPSSVPAGISLASLAVVADAVTTPFQACRRAGVGPGDLAVFVGAGGVGAFGVQIASALGAKVVAIDVDAERLELVAAHGAALTLNAREVDGRAAKQAIRGFAKDDDLAATEWKLFETSGTAAGQATAFDLLVPGAYLSVVGYTPESATVPVSKLMAFDARAEGNWGCLPELYPPALQLVLDGKVKLEPFIETHPMANVNHVLAAVHERKLTRRAVLVPDWS